MADKQDLRLRDLLGGRKGMWAFSWALGALTLLATVALLAISGWFISAAAVAGITALASAYTFDYFRPAAVIRTLAIIRTAGRYGERLASHQAVLSLLHDLRCRFFARLGGVPNAKMHMASDGMMHRLTSDIDLLDQLPLRFFMPWLWALLLQAVFAVWLLLAVPDLPAYVLLPLPLAGMVLPVFAARRGISLAKADAEASEIRRRRLLQPLSVMTALLLWRRWHDCEKVFLEADRQYGYLQLRQQHLAGLYAWMQQTALAALLGLVLWQTQPLLSDGTLGVPLLLAVVLAVFGLNEVLLPLVSQFMALGFSMAARDRLNELGRVTDSSSRPVPAITVWPKDIWELRVENVSACRNGALNGPDDVSFVLPKGGVLWVSGRSGAGKSTLLDVLAGELLPMQGRLKLNGQDFASFQADDAIGYLAQQVDIFDLTLAENLRLGNEHADDEALWQVLEKVQLAEWVRAQSQGLATRLGEYGTEVSGGQARRIALARILLKPRALLILDEPFAGLDTEAREKLAAVLLQEQSEGLLVVASHQSVLANARVQRLVLKSD